MNDDDRRVTLLGAFRFAARGLVGAALSQRNLRLHLVAAILVGTFGSVSTLRTSEELALLLAVFLVLSGEVMNTALEAAVDLAAPRPDARARLAKDAAAGAVLVLAAGAVVVFLVVLARHWSALWASWRDVGAVAGAGLMLAALGAWLVFPLRRPRALEVAAALGGLAVAVFLALRSTSLALAAVAALAFGVCAATALARRRGEGSANEI